MSLQLQSVHTSTSATRAEPEMSFTELREEGYVLDLVRISAAAGEAPEPFGKEARFSVLLICSISVVVVVVCSAIAWSRLHTPCVVTRDLRVHSVVVVDGGRGRGRGRRRRHRLWLLLLVVQRPADEVARRVGGSSGGGHGGSPVSCSIVSPPPARAAEVEDARG